MKRLLAIFMIAGFITWTAAAQDSTPPPNQSKQHVSHGDAVGHAGMPTTGQPDSMSGESSPSPSKKSIVGKHNKKTPRKTTKGRRRTTTPNQPY